MSERMTLRWVVMVLSSLPATAVFAPASAEAGSILGLGQTCLDVRGGGSADGTPVQIHRCTDGANQDWKPTAAAELRVFGSKCLDIAGGTAADGAAVQIFECHGGSNQKWTLAQSGELRGLGNKCLDIRGGGSRSGTAVQVHACHGGANQRWRFIARSLNVSLYIDQIAADAANETGSDNTRDEAYVVARGSIPTGFVSERLPRYPSNDDYYEFTSPQIANSANLAQWTNQDQAPVGRPVLWAGTLADQQSGEFLVVLNEQDNKDWPAARQAILAGLAGVGAIAGAAGAGAAVTATIETAQSLANQLPAAEETGDLDDVIGAFSVRFTNVDGELQTVWLAIPEILLGQGASRSTTIHDVNNPYALARRASGRELAVFNMNGTGGGSYRVAAAVEIKRSPPLTAWEYLGRLGGVNPVEGLVSDRCNRPQAVKVQGRNGTVLMTDEPREVRVAKARFGWLCASSQEWATCEDGTNLVVGQKGPDDVLRWYCFRERSF